MDENINLSELFNYYRFVIKYENIFQLRYDEKYFSEINNFDIIQSIRDDITKAKTQNQRLNYNSFTAVKQFKKSITKSISQYSNDKNLEANVNKFIEQILFLEKAKNYAASKENNRVLKPDMDIENSEYFSIKKTDLPTFEFGIFISLVGLRNKQNIEYIPFLVLSFHNRNKNNKPVSSDVILEQIKQELKLEYDKRIDSIPLQAPLLTINPLLLENYQLNSLIKEDLSLTDGDWFGLFQKVKAKTELRDEIFKPELYLSAYSTSLTASLIKMYDWVLHNTPNKLLTKFFTLHKNKLSDIQTAEIDERDVISSKIELETFAKHIGAFNCKHPLASTQRVAFSTYLNDQFPILPVNGAPGTGKTSLLRGIFGQYIVESALEAYINYDKSSEIKFRTPLVCSSTNNLALVNVSKGIEDAFQETLHEKKHNILYSRWLECEITTTIPENNLDLSEIDMSELDENEILELDDGYSVNNINLHSQLFVPLVKTRKDPKSQIDYFIMTPEMLNSSVMECANNSERFLTYFQQYEPNILVGHDSLTDKLIHCAYYFYQKIKKNIDIIQLNSKQISDIDDLDRFEKYLLQKYIAKGNHLSEIQNSLKKISSQQTSWADWVTKYNYTLEKNIEIKDNIETNKSKLNNLASMFKPIIANNDWASSKILSIIENINDNEIKSLESYQEIYREIYDQLNYDLVYQEEVKFQEIQKSLFLQAGIFAKILFKWLNRGKLARDLRTAKEYKEQVIQCVQEEIILSSECRALAKFKLEINLVKNDLKLLLDNINSYEKELTELNQEITMLHNFLRKFLVFDADDVCKFVGFYDVLKLKEQISNDKLHHDMNERTDNFYYAIHLLEALFFLDQVNASGKNYCPCCKRNSLLKNNSGFKCENCDASFSKKAHEDFRLTDSQICNIFKFGFIRFNGKYLVVTCNKKANVTWININYGYPVATRIDYNKILPIFPMLNITCNSFGNFIVNEKKEVQKDIFDFLLIDEAGTIPPSKMIILYGAKKCMLFGDVKQLKPVYSYSSNTEAKILPYFIKNDFHVNIINQYYSSADSQNCQANNAMTIANNSCQIVLPYNYSKLDGDIWLKEHFRCKKSIVAIANELAYENEIKYMQEQNGYLFFIESMGERTENTNKAEAELILDFILNNTNKFKKLLGTPEISDKELYKSIGIITPFSNQENLLADLIDNSILKEHTSVGTVHKFQGSERKIIIFSTVYSDGDAENMFFNRIDTSMLNVAITRAKDIFICVGRRSLLDKPNNLFWYYDEAY